MIVPITSIANYKVNTLKEPTLVNFWVNINNII